MKKSIVLFTILILGLALISSQWVDAASKNQKAIKKGLSNFFDEKGDKDACAVYAVKENNGDPVEGKWVYNNTSDEQCFPEDPVPEPPKNQPPIIRVTSPITGVINQTIIINASVTDPDGNITNITWNQESGVAVNFTSNSSILMFTPLVNNTYVFSIDAQDNNGTSTLAKVTVNVGTVVDPNPNPSNETRFINFVGDVDGDVGEQVFNEIKSTNAYLTVVLGDLWYGDWDKFYNTYGTLGNKLACVLGNHEYSDDTDHLALPYCGNDWYIKDDGVLIIGVNANVDLDTQLDKSRDLLTPEFFRDVDTIILNTHQPCRNTDGSHHGVESDVRAFCEGFEELLPDGINKYFIAGHEHLMMKGEANQIEYFISGGGGRDHYNCGELDDIFSWCDDSHYGFLQLRIDPDGKITEQFIDYNGEVVN